MHEGPLKKTAWSTQRKILFALTGSVLLLVFLFTLLLFLLLLPTNQADNSDPAKRKEMQKIILKWGRLAPFPDSIRDFSIKTEGNMFTRSFRAEFTLYPGPLKKWISASDGLREAKAFEKKTGIFTYHIKPGNGANRAEVEIDTRKGLVKIYVSHG
ncbi:hypothetical protein ACFL35_01465 [Candidatus Riflebacteria bacterium]